VAIQPIDAAPSASQMTGANATPTSPVTEGAQDETLDLQLGVGAPAARHGQRSAGIGVVEHDLPLQAGGERRMSPLT
jgi:hypothetical protein